MKSIILAAGKGSRLMPLTKNIPKCLVEINGKSIIEHQLSVLKNFNLDEINLITGYRSNKLNYLQCKKIFNSKFDSTNMLYSLSCASNILDDEILISYGDSIYDNKIIRKIIDCKLDICVASDINWKRYWESRYENPLDDLETFVKDSQDRIISLGSKPKNYSQINGQYIGLIKLSKKGAVIFKDKLNDYKLFGIVNSKPFEKAYITDFIQQLIYDKVKIFSVSISSDYVEIDTVEDLKSKMTVERVERISKF
jgi:L-glutamine-phosphate cytidylyltransferase